MSTPDTWVFFLRAYIRGVEVLKAPEATAPGRHWHLVGMSACSVGALWHAWLVRAMPTGTYKNHDDGGSLRGRGRPVGAFPSEVSRLLARNGGAFGRVVSSRCCSHVKL